MAQRFDAAHQIPDVFGTDAATAAHSAYSQIDVTHRIGGQIFRTGHVDHPVVDAFGNARVRLNNNRQRHFFTEDFQRGQHAFRSLTAIQAQRGRRMTGCRFQPFQ